METIEDPVVSRSAHAVGSRSSNLSSAPSPYLIDKFCVSTITSKLNCTRSQNLQRTLSGSGGASLFVDFGALLRAPGAHPVLHENGRRRGTVPGSARVSRAFSYGIANFVGFAGGTPALPGGYFRNGLGFTPTRDGNKGGNFSSVCARFDQGQVMGEGVPRRPKGRHGQAGESSMLGDGVERAVGP